MGLKKSPKADLRQWYGTSVQVGMVVALAVLVFAFRANFDRGDAMVIEQVEQEVMEMEEILQTKQIQKPPPPPRPPVPVEVPNDEILEDDDLDLDASLDLDEPLAALPPPPPTEEVEEEQEPEIFQVVEDMPTFEGCPDPDPAAQMVCLQQLGSKIKYPEIARKAGVEGRVYVSFVVDEYGNVLNPTVARGIGAGCDQEALRVISEAKFTPGRQRGKAVKVRMSIPIQFKLR